MATQLPQAINKAELAERGVIGSVLLDESCIDIAKGIISPEDFTTPINRVIFSAMCDLCDAGKPIDMATIMTIAIKNPIFANNDGNVYLCNCMNSLPSACRVEEYSSIVRSESLRRKLIDFSERIRTKDFTAIDNIDSEIAKMSDELLELSAGSTVTPWVDFKTALKEACEEMVDETKANGKIYTGFTDLDAKLNGLRPGALTIIAARPAMGKTALGLNILVNTALYQEISSAFFSLEMSKKELVDRIISSVSMINGNSIRKGHLDDNEWPRYIRAVDQYQNAPIYIDETPGIDITVLRERARRMHRQHKIKLIIVDYLQLMIASDRKVQSREQEVSTISRGLKGLAKELRIPVIAIAQLNRAVESRIDKRPSLADLRDSGGIEQDADNIMFIYREDYYKRDEAPTNVAEVIIAKQRSGPTGIIKLYWQGEYTKFSDLEYEFQEKPSPSPQTFKGKGNYDVENTINFYDTDTGL